MTKRLIALIAALALTTIGLVTASTGTAQAKDCPYTGCFDTTTALSGQKNYSPRERPKVRVRVTTNGNAQPRGRIVFRVKKVGGGYWKQKSIFYGGGLERATLKRLDGPGKYRIIAIYKAGPDRPFRSSRDKMGITVRR